MQVNRHIHLRSAQLSRQAEIVDQSLKPTTPFDDPHVVQIRMMANDGRGVRLDQICEPGFRKSARLTMTRYCCCPVGLPTLPRAGCPAIEVADAAAR